MTDRGPILRHVMASNTLQECVLEILLLQKRGEVEKVFELQADLYIAAQEYVESYEAAHV